MDIKKCKRNHNHSKPIQLSIRISKKLSNWLKKENLSPTAIFNEACKELGFKE